VFKRVFDLDFTQPQSLKLWIGAVVILALINIFLVARQKVRVVIALLFLALAVGGGLYVRNIREVHAVDSFATRVWTWGSAFRGFEERPLLGWGPENFPAVFDRHFDPRHFVPGQSTETWFDRAHSVFFDYLAETGFLGFLAYLSMFITFFVQFFRRALPRGESIFTEALMVGLPAGYLVQGAVLFDVLPIYINLFLFLAFANWWLSLPPHHHHHAQ
jgi:O-antigen ligase